MSELVEFLRARLDEDEQVAREATNHTGRWRWDHGYGEQCNDPECPYGELVDEAEPGETIAGTVLMDVHGYDVRESWQGAEHIARHDPARVLAEVEAKRRTIRAHDKWCQDQCEAIYPNVGPDAAYYWQMKLHAELYDDHPDYDEAWRP